MPVSKTRTPTPLPNHEQDGFGFTNGPPRIYQNPGFGFTKKHPDSQKASGYPARHKTRLGLLSRDTRIRSARTDALVYKQIAWFTKKSDLVNKRLLDLPNQRGIGQ